MLKKLISLHIKGHQGLLFEKKGKTYEVKQELGAQVKINADWVRKTSLIIQSSGFTPYIHLDVKIPYGEEITEHALEQELTEKLGAARQGYGKAYWTSFFNEDTQQGTSHRIFVTFNGEEDSLRSECLFPIEIAVLGLAFQYRKEGSHSHFQFVCSFEDKLYSVLFIKGSPFHLLRVDKESEENLQERLEKQKKWGQNKDKFNIPLILCQPKLVNELGVDPSNSTCHHFSGFSDKVNDYMLQAGLLMAYENEEFIFQDRKGEGDKKRLQIIRDKAFFVKGMLVGLLLVSILIGWSYYKMNTRAEVLLDLQAQSKEYKPRLNEIESLIQRKKSLLDSIEALYPLWYPPIPWHYVIDGIQQALPVHSGIYGIRVEILDRDSFKVNFKAWIKNWDDVSEFQKRLQKSPNVSEVVFHDQKRNLKKDVVTFPVSLIVKSGGQ